MITKKYLKELEFSNINGVFDYILESIANGQISQAKETINLMSQRQKNAFVMYLENDCPFHQSYIETAKKML